MDSITLLKSVTVKKKKTSAIWYTSNMSLDVLFSGRLETIILSQLVRSR